MEKFECQGKQKFDSKKDADREIFRHMLETFGGHVDLRSYKCKFCDGWHLTSKV